MFSVGSHLQKQYPELFGWKVGGSDYTIFLEWDWSENIVGDKAVFFSIWGYEVQGLGITHGLRYPWITYLLSPKKQKNMIIHIFGIYLCKPMYIIPKYPE